MTDDLVKRLRGQAEYVALVAGDRIEQLEAAMSKIANLPIPQDEDFQLYFDTVYEIARAALAGEKKNGP